MIDDIAGNVRASAFSKLSRNSYAFVLAVSIAYTVLVLAFGLRLEVLVPVGALIAGWSSSWSP
jgi:hypothetical protein